MTESCTECKYYEQGEEFDNYGYSLIPSRNYVTCNKTNYGNLKHFPFRKKLKCFEKKED